jgi:cold shock CspA family protein
VRLDKSKGYGFLVDSSGEQRFFHRSAVLNSGFDALTEQQAVDFEPYVDERGARAQKVRPAGTAVKESDSTRAPKPSPKTPKASAWKSDLSPFRNGSGAPAPGRKRPRI